MSISTPRTDEKQHTALSLKELNDDSGSDSGEQVMIQEISNLQSDIQNAKRQKRQIDLKIESLQHDLKCAEKARELGNGAAASIAKRLASIFGEALKEEDLIGKIQQLQQRSREARQEVESLNVQLANLRVSTPQKQRSSQRKMDAIREEIQKAKIEEQTLTQQIHEVDNEIDQKQEELNNLNMEIDDIVAQFNEAVGTKNLTVPEIRDKIYHNSDQFILSQCERVSKLLKLPFDPRMRVSEFIDDLRERISNLRKKVTPSDETDEKFEQLTRDVDMSLAELKEINSQIRKLEKEKKELKVQISTEVPAIVEDSSPVIGEQIEQQNRRTKKLRNSLKEALSIAGYDWILPKSQRDLCDLYITLLRTMQHDIASLEHEEDPTPDLTILRSKVHSVRKQNREIRHRIHNLVSEKH